MHSPSPSSHAVLSDIDDTIKITNIPDGKEVILENTFLNATQAVTGMSELYQKWAAQGGHVHYVSNGPWQLFPMLSDFFAKFNFPPGSAHLRIINRSDVVSTMRGPPGAHKLEAIPKIMKVINILFHGYVRLTHCSTHTPVDVRTFQTTNSF